MQTPKSVTVKELLELLKQEGIDSYLDANRLVYVFLRSPSYTQKHESDWSDKDVKDALDDLFSEMPDSLIEEIPFTSDYIHHISHHNHKSFIASLVSKFYPSRSR